MHELICRFWMSGKPPSHLLDPLMGLHPFAYTRNHNTRNCSPKSDTQEIEKCERVVKNNGTK